MLIKTAFIWLKYSKNKLLAILFIFSVLIYFNILFTPVMAKLNFQQPLLQSSVSHDPS